MPRSLTRGALSILAALVFASCGEKPPRSDPEAHRALSNEMPQHPAYERTRQQGEAERIGN